jgi:hypothetical protein
MGTTLKYLATLFFVFIAATIPLQAAYVSTNAPSIHLGAMGSTSNTTLGLANLSGTPATTTFSIYAASPVTGVTAGNVVQFHRDTVPYVVPAGKSTYCFNVTVADQSGAGGFQLVYSDAASSNNATTGSLTNPSYQTGNAASYVMYTTSASTPLATPGSVRINTGKYVQIQCQSAHVFGAHMDCFEQ